MKKATKNILLGVLMALLFFGVVLVLIGSNNMPTSMLTTTVNTTTINFSQSQIYGPTSEIRHVQQVDPNATTSMFSCSGNSNCTLVHTSSCFNNLPSQQACISDSYNASYAANYSNYLNSSHTACPQFFLAGRAGCLCINNGCSLVYNSSTP